MLKITQSSNLIFCLCIDLPDRKDRDIVSSSYQAVALTLPLCPSTLSSPLCPVRLPYLHHVVEPSEIVVGEVWLPSAKVIFSSICVSDSASAYGSTSHIIQLLAASEMFTRVDNDISDKGNMVSAPPFTVTPCAADITLPVITQWDQVD